MFVGSWGVGLMVGSVVFWLYNSLCVVLLALSFSILFILNNVQGRILARYE